MKKYFILSIAVLALTSCKTTMKEAWNHFPNEINLNDYDNLQFVKVKKGTTVLVKVEANPSTGYSWKTETEKDCSVNVNEGNYKQNDAPDGMVGVPGVRTYEVKGENLGSCLVEFQQTAPGESTPTTRKGIYFIVE